MELLDEIHKVDPEIIQKKDFYFGGVFTSSGILEGSSFFQEFIKRLESKIIPSIYDDKDIRMYIFSPRVRKILMKKEYSELEIKEIFGAIYNLDQSSEQNISSKVASSLDLNLLKIKYHLNSSSFHAKSLSYPGTIFNFEEVEKSFAQYRKEQSASNFRLFKQVLIKELENLEKSKFIHNSGISFDLSYRYLISEDLINRFIKLLSLHYYFRTKNFSTELYEFFRVLRSEIIKSKSVFSLIRNYWSILNYEATEYSARLGQKYSGSSINNIFAIFMSSLIGGFFVGFLAFLKPISSSELLGHSFLQYLSHGVIYSFIFLCIYFFKGTLATKQPAKIICSILNVLDTKDQSDQSLSEVAALLRMSIINQVFSVLGNVVAGAGCSYFLFRIFEKYNIYLLSDKVLLKEFNSLNIFTSRSLYYACIAGFWLVLSGIAGGLIDNWYKEKNFHLAKNRDFSFLAKKTFSFLTRHIGQIGSSVSLAFALAFSPYLGELLGVDLSIRHVTFASTQIPYIFFSSSTVDINVLTPILLGVVGIGVFNVLIGYGLTFYMVFKSRKLKGSNLKKLFLKLLIKNLL